MFDHTHYVPILKAKSGEFDAMSHINESASIKARMTPLLELTPIPMKWLDDQDDPIPSKTIDDHIDWLVTHIEQSWDSNAPIFIDGFYIETEDVLASNTEPIDGVLSRLRNGFFNFIPVVGIDRVGEYTDVVAHYAKNGCDVCLRLKPHDLDNVVALEEQIDGLLKHLATAPKDVHLLIDYCAIAPSLASALKAALQHQLSAIPRLTKWKTVTLSASCFPADLADVSKFSIDTFDRSEWDVWTHLRQLHRQGRLKRMPTFGDYTITHPDLVVFDPRKMRMSPKIKYTDTLQWVIAKGEAFRRKKDEQKSTPADVQYQKLCDMLMKHPAWRGKDFSWGDEYIAKCAAKEVGPGRPQDWVTIGTVHHIVSVVRQLASPF